MRIPTFVTLIIIPFSWTFSKAQNTDRANQIIYVNFPDHTVKAEVLSAKTKINTNNNFNYTWFANNKIMQTRGSYDGKLLNGLYKSFYLNDNLKEQGYFKKGLKQGEWINWFDNGKINQVSKWKHGMRNGETADYNEKGMLIKTTGYKNDKVNGYLKIYEEGKIIKQQKFKNGIEVIPVINKRKRKNKNDTDLIKDSTAIQDSTIKVTDENFIGPKQQNFKKKNDNLNNQDKKEKDVIKGEKNEAVSEQKKIKEDKKKTFFEKLKGFFSKKEKSPQNKN